MHYFCMSTIANVVTVWNFEVISINRNEGRTHNGINYEKSDHYIPKHCFGLVPSLTAINKALECKPHIPQSVCQLLHNLGIYYKFKYILF